MSALDAVESANSLFPSGNVAIELPAWRTWNVSSLQQAAGGLEIRAALPQDSSTPQKRGVAFQFARRQNARTLALPRRAGKKKIDAPIGGGHGSYRLPCARTTLVAHCPTRRGLCMAFGWSRSGAPMSKCPVGVEPDSSDRGFQVVTPVVSKAVTLAAYFKLLSTSRTSSLSHKRDDMWCMKSRTETLLENGSLQGLASASPLAHLLREFDLYLQFDFLSSASH